MGVRTKKTPASGGGRNQLIIYFFTAFLALSFRAPILAFAVSAIAFTVESTFVAVESIAVFALSTMDDVAESVLATASLLPPPHDVKVAAITSTVRIFFIKVILVGRKSIAFFLFNQGLWRLSSFFIFSENRSGWARLLKENSFASDFPGNFYMVF